MAFGAATDLFGNVLNYHQQSKKMSQDRRIQKLMWEREDTAHQRAVADLRAAGLSPTLAAGAGAQAGPVVRTEAPQLAPMGMADAMLASKQMDKLDSEKQYVDAQKYALGYRLPEELALLQSQAWQNNINANTANWNLGLAMRRGTTTNPQSTYRDLVDAFGTAFERIIRPPSNQPGPTQHTSPRLIWNEMNPINLLSPFSPQNNNWMR